jgi:hypothetical protein
MNITFKQTKSIRDNKDFMAMTPNDKRKVLFSEIIDYLVIVSEKEKQAIIEQR